MTEPDNPGAAFEAFSEGTAVNSGTAPQATRLISDLPETKPSASLDDLAGLLSEFDNATKPAEPVETKAPQPETTNGAQQSDLGPILSAIENSRTAMADEARKHLSSHAAMVEALYADRIRE